MSHYYTADGKQNVVNWITESIQHLIQQDGELLKPKQVKSKNKLDEDRTFNREVHEVAINHRLAHYLEGLISKYGYANYHVDIEYNGYINNPKMVRSIDTGAAIEVRPDIIIHKRTGLNETIPHLLVVEAKRNATIETNKNHVRDIMLDHHYRYKYGLLVSYYESEQNINCKLKTFEDNVFVTREFSVAKERVSD